MDGMGWPLDAAAAAPSAHIDTFARDNLPPREAWPALRFDLPELRYPAATVRGDTDESYARVFSDGFQEL